jgi:hypothetical protein
VPVLLVRDAVGSRTHANRDAAIDRMREAAEMAIFEWLEHCERPEFKEVLALVKQEVWPLSDEQQVVRDQGRQLEVLQDDGGAGERNDGVGANLGRNRLNLGKGVECSA